MHGRGWVAQDDGRAQASVGIQLQPKASHPGGSSSGVEPRLSVGVEWVAMVGLTGRGLGGSTI